MPSSGEPAVERFGGTRFLGWFTLLLGAAVLVAGFWDGTDPDEAAVLVAVAIAALCSWLAFVRPTVRAHADHLLLRNMVSDARIPWHLIDEIDVRQSVRVFTVDGQSYAAEALRRPGAGSAVAQWRAHHQLSPLRFEGYHDQGTVAPAEFNSQQQAARRLRELRAEREERSLRRERVQVRPAWPELALMGLLLAGFVVLLVV